MTISPKSRIKKGKRFENHLRDYFATKLDGYTRHTKGSGSGTDKMDLVIPQYNIKIEAKNQKNLSIVDWWEKAKSQCFDEIPVLAVRNPRMAEFKETLIVLELEDFVALMGKIDDSESVMEIEPVLNYSQRNALEMLKSAIAKVKKEFNNE